MGISSHFPKHLTANRLKGINYMELIVISESKLKIMLSAPDMEHYNLQTLRRYGTDADTRAAFRKIFEDARTEIGFDTQGERLFIQLYDSLEGGCEIFVTKLGSNELHRPDAGHGDILHSFEGATPRPTASVSDGETKLLDHIYSQDEEGEDMADHPLRLTGIPAQTAKAFMLESTEHMLTVCHRLLREGYRGRSSAYISGDGVAWYLFLDIPEAALFDLPIRYAYLNEYAKQTDPGITSIYLSEYGRCICPDRAVETLGQL